MSLFERLLFPYIGTQQINEITAPEILVPLRRIEGLGVDRRAKIYQY